MTENVSEDKLLAALATLELNLSRQITSDLRALERKLDDKVSKSEFEVQRVLVQEIREHGSTQAVLALKRTETLETKQGDLMAWRNRLAGAITAVAFVVTATGAHVWFGIG